MRKSWGQESIGTILQRNRTNVLISLKLEKGLNLLSHTHELINIAQQKGLNLSRKLRHLRSNLLAMIRESLSKHLVGLNKEFRFRGVEPGRLENFSDACFALAITLLLISTSPPSSFEQVKRFTWEVIPFTLCISLAFRLLLPLWASKSNGDSTEYHFYCHRSFLCISIKIPYKSNPPSLNSAFWRRVISCRTRATI